MNGYPVRFYVWHGDLETAEPSWPCRDHYPKSSSHRRICEPCRWAYNLWQRTQRRGGYPC